jgi:hypothetical protein
MEFQYQQEILEQLLVHGIRPLTRTRPAIAFRYVSDLYRYELRRLKHLHQRRFVPPDEYVGRVIEVRHRYPLVSVPVKYWTVPGTPADPEDLPLC